MIHRMIIVAAVFVVWFDSIGCSITRVRRSIQPVSLQNVSRTLANYNIHSDGHSKVDHQHAKSYADHGRGLRKINLLGNLFQKRQPLYLLNGTVCRFVNTVPICTTLSTTGVLPPSSSSGSGGATGGSGGSSSGGGTAQGARPPASPSPAPAGLNSGGQNAQSTSGNAPRPAALIEDDSEDINVNGLNTAQLLGNNDPNQVYQLNPAQQQQNLKLQQQQQLHQNQQQTSNFSPVVNNNLQPQTSQQPPTAVQPEARPFGYLVQRRPGPFNLRRPQYRPISATASGQAIAS